MSNSPYCTSLSLFFLPGFFPSFRSLQYISLSPQARDSALPVPIGLKDHGAWFVVGIGVLGMLLSGYWVCHGGSGAETEGKRGEVGEGEGGEREGAEAGSEVC